MCSCIGPTWDLIKFKDIQPTDVDLTINGITIDPLTKVADVVADPTNGFFFTPADSEFNTLHLWAKDLTGNIAVSCVRGGINIVSHGEFVGGRPDIRR